MDGEIDHNPFTITASKNGKTKNSYKDIIKINSTNSAQNLIIKLTKKEDNDELDLEYTLWVMCICFIVIISVFTILLSVNIYLVRKKAGLSRLSGPVGLDKSKESKSRVHGGEVITCSECGTEITEDALFCPHCGEFFEGDEFTCSGCNYKLSDDATSCPKCGKIFDHKVELRSKRKDRTGLASGGKEIDETSDKLFCSDCGAVVDDKDSRCPGCGLSFSDDYSKGGLKKETQITSSSSKGVKRAYKVTAKDEERIKKREIESAVGDDSYICSMCGGAVSERATSCPNCGTELE
jgi:rubrerythrin